MQPGRNVKKRRFDPSQQGPIWRNAIQKAASCTTGFWVWCLCCSCTGTKSVRKNMRNTNYKHNVGMLGFEVVEDCPFWRLVRNTSSVHLSLVKINWQVLQANCCKIRWVFFFPQTKETTHRPSAIRELFQNNEIAEDFFSQPAGALTSLEFAWLPFSYQTPVAWGANFERVTCMAHIQPTKLASWPQAESAAQ